jgi:hypothetical protein
MEVGLFVWQDESRKETDEKDSGSLTVDEIEHYLRLKHGMALRRSPPVAHQDPQPHETEDEKSLCLIPRSGTGHQS